MLRTDVMTADPIPTNRSTPKNPRCDLSSVTLRYGIAPVLV